MLNLEVFSSFTSMIEQAPKFEFSKKVVTNLKEPETLKIIKSINDDYLYWDKIKYKKTKFTPQELWGIVKLSRILKTETITFGKHNFKYVTTDYIQKIVHFFDMNIGGYMGAKNIIPEEDKTRYLVSSIIEEAISSSQIEGANTTRKHAKEMLWKEIKPHTKSEQMIVNNYITIKHITQNKTENLTPENLLEIHRLISKDTKSKEGVFRTRNDII